MPNHSFDWFNQAIRDLEQAEDSRAGQKAAMNGRALLHTRRLRRP